MSNIYYNLHINTFENGSQYKYLLTPSSGFSTPSLFEVGGIQPEDQGVEEAEPDQPNPIDLSHLIPFGEGGIPFPPPGWC